MAAAGTRLVRVTDAVYAAVTGHVNWTLVTGDDDRVLLIDAGYPGDRAAVLGTLAELGRRPEDVAAILLTHAHVDHFGTAIWFAAEHRTPVYCHADEVGHARRDYLEQVSPAQLARHAWRPRWLRWSAQIAALGALTRARSEETELRRSFVQARRKTDQQLLQRPVMAGRQEAIANNAARRREKD